MPVQVTYPGVYIEELPSGVRTIVGVSTSDGATVDYFTRGPLNRPVRITSMGDFNRIFGGLNRLSAASYAIRQFFRNGGSVVWVVRVVSDSAAPASLTLQGGSPLQNTLVVDASSPGMWGTRLRVAVEASPRDPTRFFNLLVREVETVNGREQVVASETHLNLSMDTTSSRYAVAVVNDGSALVQLSDEGLGDLPVPLAFTALGGSPSDGVEPGSTAWETEGAEAILGDEGEKTGIYALLNIPAPFSFNQLLLPAVADLPDDAYNSLVTDAIAFCERQRAFFLADIPSSVETPDEMVQWMQDHDGLRSNYAAVYFPRVLVADPLNENRSLNVAASGTLAGVYARTDANRGVWKAPAGTDADLRGATLTTLMTDMENGALNPLGINALRNFPIFGNVAWGARTLDGADQQASEWKYIPVRRTALFIENSLFAGLKWVVFEPNDEPLWAQIRLNVGAFMQDLFRKGAFQGKTPREAYFVKCDSETTTQNDIDRGIVNIVVGFAPLKPAEFVVLQIQQIAGELAA